MGREIGTTSFEEADFREFKKRLKDETCILMDWFRNETFETEPYLCGFELEGWLIDSEGMPAPLNEEFLSKMTSHLVVPELAKFNFEINNTPRPIKGNLLSEFQNELEHVWSLCEKHSEETGVQPLTIGILPTLKDEHLTLENMSSMKRYAALNQEIFRLRKNLPINLRIDGKDQLNVVHHDVMLESATTSLQIHIQLNPEQAVAIYNAAQIASAPMVALAANAPFLFGKELWEDTRIPTFEQAIFVASFRDVHGDQIGRVNFGTGYKRNSLMEAFLENLDGFPVLLPLVYDDDPSWLSHLRLHNGTIWRWNRPLIGLNSNGKPHLRIEHRTPSAGPSLEDVVANVAFFLGLVKSFIEKDPLLEQSIPFEQARNNFYSAAQFGLDASVKWSTANKQSLRRLILDDLLPAARQGLHNYGIDSDDIKRYLDNNIAHRVKTGQNGAKWQREFVKKYGPDFKTLTHVYHQNQKSGKPVHEWAI